MQRKVPLTVSKAVMIALLAVSPLQAVAAPEIICRSQRSMTRHDARCSTDCSGMVAVTTYVNVFGAWFALETNQVHHSFACSCILCGIEVN